jgi:hypothetical protein
MKKNNKNYYYFKFYKGFIVKTDNKFAEACIGIGIVILCSAVLLHAVAIFFGK